MMAAPAQSTTFAQRIAAAWEDAAEFANQRAATLNRDPDVPDDTAHAIGDRFRRVEQSRWVDAYERAERQSRLVRDVTIADEDR